MFYLKSQAPQLQTAYCLIDEYDEAWVETLLRDAAQKAGITLPYAGDMAQSIMYYLREEVDLKTIPLEQFFYQLKEMLVHLGFEVIAEQLVRQTPPVDVRLDTMAKESPLPLFFYSKLNSKIKELKQLGITHFRFQGKRKCSIILGARRRACPASRKALYELNAFLTPY